MADTSGEEACRKLGWGRMRQGRCQGMQGPGWVRCLLSVNALCFVYNAVSHSSTRGQGWDTMPEVGLLSTQRAHRLLGHDNSTDFASRTGQTCVRSPNHSPLSPRSS